MLGRSVAQHEAMLEVERLAVARRALEQALNEGAVVRMHPSKHRIERRLRISIELEQLVGLVGPHELAALDVPPETPGEAEPLGGRQISFAAA